MHAKSDNEEQQPDVVDFRILLQNYADEHAVSTSKAAPHAEIEGEIHAEMRPGHHLMDRIDLEIAIAAAGGKAFSGDPDDATSREEGQRLRLLAHYRDDDEILFKPHLIADDAIVGRLAKLELSCPNMREVTRLVRRACLVSMRSGHALVVPPFLLVGPPGCGKTHFLRSLGKAIGTKVELIAGTTVSDASSLTGYGTAFRGAGPGRIAKSFMSSSTSAPMIVIDECEKLPIPRWGTPPLDQLLTLLDRVSAREYMDDYLQVPLHADRALWALTANDTESLSPPLLDRVVSFQVEPIRADQQGPIFQSMLADVCGEHGISLEPLGASVIGSLRPLGLRRARVALGLAIGMAVEADRDALTPADVTEAAAVLGGDRAPPRMGFVIETDPH